MMAVTPANPKLGDTVRVYFATSGLDGARIAPSSAFEADDFRIYKNGGTTEKATTNGVTISTTFDSLAGLHVLSIDTSNDTGDTGFWENGASYSVALYPDETIDGKTVSAWIGVFSLAAGVNVSQWNGTAIPGTDTAGVPRVTIKSGTAAGELDLTSGVSKVNLTQVLGSALSEGAAGRLAASLVTFLNVASPVLTAASVNQTGDSFARLGAPAGASISADIAAAKAAIDAVATAVQNLNNLSAKSNIFGSALLEIPDAGTRVYEYFLVVKDDEDALVDLEDVPDLSLTNAAGDDRSAMLSAAVRVSLGQYRWTLTVEDDTASEPLMLTAEGEIDGDPRVAKLGVQVVDYDTSTAIAAIQSAIGSLQGSLPPNFASLGITVDGKISALASNAISAGVMSTDSIGASEFSAAAANKIRDAILNRVLAGNHDTAGSVGRLIQDVPTAGQNADAVWDEETAGHVAAGTFGAGFGTILSRVSAAFATLVENLTAMITGSGVNAKYTEKALEEAPAGAGGGDATAENQTAILKLLQADVTLNTSVSPWRLVWKEAGTETVLFEKELRQVNGANVTSMEHRIANQVAP